MAMINDATQSRRLDTHASGTTMLGQDVSKGDEDYLQVAGRFDGLLPYAEALKNVFDKGGTKTGKFVGRGGLGAARERLKALQRGEIESTGIPRRKQVKQPAAPTEPLAPGAPAIGETPTAQDAAGLGVPGAASMTPKRVVPLETIDANLANQSNRLRPPSISGDEVLAARLEPERTALVSEGLTDFTAVGARGDVKIPDEGSIHATIENISQQYHRSGDITDATRGTVTQEVSEELAATLGMDPKALIEAVLNYKDTGGVPYVSGANLSETIMAVRNLFYTEMSKLDALAEKASSSAASSEDLLNFRQQLDLASQLQLNVKGIQTEVGRSLGVYRYPIDPKAGARRDLDMENILQQFGGEADIRDLLKAYQQLPAGGPRAKFIQRAKPVQRFTNALYEWWINMLLSSPITHVKNFGAAGLTTFAEIPVGLTAATYGTARRTLTNYEGGITYGDVYAKAFGQLMSMGEALGAAGHAYRTGKPEIAGSKLTVGPGVNAGRRTPAISGEAFGASGWAGDFIDVIGSATTMWRLPTRALEFEDTFWKVAAQRGSLWEQAWREARTRGLKGEEASNFMSEFMFNPPAAAIKDADDLARKVTLQDFLENTPGREIQKLARWGPMRWFVPFIKTPYNALTFAVEHSPLAFWTKRYRDAVNSGDPVKMHTANSRMALGWGAAAVVGYHAHMGHITGGGPTDAGQRASLYRQGWRPYSILIGGNYYSYHGAEPYSTIIGIVADMVEIYQSGMVEGDDAEELWTATMFAFSKNLTNKTFMEGFSNLMSAMADPDRHAGGVLKNFVRSAVPRSVATVTKILDPQMRTSVAHAEMPDELKRIPAKVRLQKYPELSSRYPEFAWLADQVDRIVAQTPGWSDTLVPKHDLWGKPVFYADALGPSFMSPIYRSAFKPNKLDKELYRLKYPESEHPDRWNNVPLTGEELEFFQKRAGKYSKKDVTFLINRPDYKMSRKMAIDTNQPPDSDRNMKLRARIRRTIRNARSRAFRDLRIHKKHGPKFLQLQLEQRLMSNDSRIRLMQQEYQQ